MKKFRRDDFVKIKGTDFGAPYNYGVIGDTHHWDNSYWVDIIMSGERVPFNENDLMPTDIKTIRAALSGEGEPTIRI